MKISKENAEILGLSKAELSIIDSLEARDSKNKDLSIINIAKVTGIPRTSLYYMLPKLEKRGFIEMKRNNKKIFWRKSRDEDFQRKYLRTLRDVTEKELNQFSPIQDDNRIQVLRGTNQLLTVFDELINLPNKSRFYTIQPDASFSQVIKKIPVSEALKVGNRIKSKEIIVESILHEKSVDSIKNNLSDKKSLKDLLASLGGRSADTVKMPEGFLSNTKAEAYLYGDKISLLNWDKEIAVVIKDKDIFHLVKEMFNSTKYLMERYDQNEKVAKKLVDLEN